MKNQLDALAWLRGLAAFIVVINHALLTSKGMYSSSDEAMYFTPLNYIDLGEFAVYLFFALSGCTLTLSSGNKIHRAEDFSIFYFKRFMRIWPVYAASVFIYLVFIEFFKSNYSVESNNWINFFLKDYTAFNILQYLSLTFNITGPSGLFNTPYWSLPVEFQYYLLLPFALFLMRGRISNFAIPLFFCVFLYAFFYAKINIFHKMEIFEMSYAFFFGVILAKAYQRCDYRIKIYHSIAFTLIIFILVSMVRHGILKISPHIYFLNNPRNFYGISAVMVVAIGLFCEQKSSKNTLLKFLKKYGEVSYSVYLFHMIFIGLAALFIVNFGVHSYLNKLFICLIVGLLGSYMLSLFTYYYIEEPSIRLGKSLEINFLKKPSIFPSY